MSFSKDLILSLVILAVVLEADLGRKKIGWFRIGRPFVVAIAIVPSYLTKLPTSSNDLTLQGVAALAGILLGLIAVSPIFVSTGFDPRFRSWLTRRRHRPGTPAAVSHSGWGYAIFWTAVTAARLAFAWSSVHAFPHALGTFLAEHRLSSAALTNAFIFLPLGMDVFRSVGLLARSQAVSRRADVPVQETQAQ